MAGSKRKDSVTENVQKNMVVHIEIPKGETDPADLFGMFSSTREKSFIFEGFDGGKRKGVSYIGFDPFAKIRLKDGVAILEREGEREESKDVFELLEKMNETYRIGNMTGGDHEKLGLGFLAGGVGYFGYETFGLLEDVSFSNRDERGVEDVYIMYYRTLVSVDHKRDRINIVSLVDCQPGGFPIEYEKRIGEIETIKQEILDFQKDSKIVRSNKPSKDDEKTGFRRCDGFEAFSEKFNSVKKRICSGDIFQGVISSRFQGHTEKTAGQAYRGFYEKSPSTYTFCIDFSDFFIAGSSPETLAKLEGGRVTTCPIAGTRRRGKNKDEDEAFGIELYKDEKEKAEHIMLVDLSRNDMGRICRPGSVSVDKYMEIERYSHVMHIASQVSGKLEEENTMYDVIKNLLPAGTLSGAPKIRAVEIIEEVEDLRRGIYGGAVGMFSFCGRMDTCIAIRTALVKDKKAYIQTGAGIVYDSDLKSEYMETISKAASVLEAMGGFIDDTYCG